MNAAQYRKMFRKYSWLLLFGSMLVLLASCGSVPATYYYRVDYPAAPPAQSDPLPLTLGVGGFDCDVLYEGERIVYRSSPYEVQYYHYRRWVAPPRKLVADAVQQQFSASGAFRRVVSSTAGEPVDYLLRGKINAFEEWDEEEAWFGSVAIEFVLYDADNGAVIWQNRYAEKTPAAQKDPLMVVEAISASLQRVVARAREDVAGFLRQANIKQ